MIADGAPFTKMSAGGNDFILFDAIDGGAAGLPGMAGDFIHRLCARALSVGADGVIRIERGAEGEIRMIYWNADGGRAALCGNGVRCVARLAALRGHAPGAGMRIRTDAALLQAGASGEVAWFRLALGAPRISAVRLTLPPDAGEMASFEGHLVEVGVPHVVMPIPDAHEMSAGRLRRIAPPLRHHPDLGAAGANLDFVTVRGRREAAIRCWERGVEGETLSSGTGCMATAIALAHAGLCDDEVSLISRTGLVSVVTLQRGGPGGLEVVLSGDARIIYTGRLGEEATRGFSP